MAGWYRGNERPSLCPRDEENKIDRRVNEVGDEENRSASDAEAVKKDVITVSFIRQKIKF